MVCSTASVWPVRAEPGTGNRSTNSSNVLASWPLCESLKSSNPRKCSGNIEGSHEGRDVWLITGRIADTWAIMPISENGSTMTVSWPKFDTNTGTFYSEGSTNVRPTTKPVFSEKTVSSPLDGKDRPPTVRVVQWRTASEYGGIEQCPTVKTRPDNAVSLRCSWRDTPPSVNSRPCLISSVWGNMDSRVSVPIIASVLRSHTRIGNSVRSPKNETRRASQNVNLWTICATQLPGRRL